MYNNLRTARIAYNTIAFYEYIYHRKKTMGPTNCFFRFFVLYIILLLLLSSLCVIIIIRVALSLDYLSLLCCCSAPPESEFLFHPLSVLGFECSDFLFYLYIILSAICTLNIIYFSGETREKRLRSLISPVYTHDRELPHKSSSTVLRRTTKSSSVQYNTV